MANSSSPQERTPATIPATSGYSGWIDKKGKAALAIYTPDTWTAASITVMGRHGRGAPEGVIYDDQGTQITITAGASRCIRLDERLFQGINELCFAADGQVAARQISIVLRDEADLISDGV